MQTHAPATRPPLIIEPTRGLAALQLRAVWEYRELLGFLVWRDVKVRYKQTLLGVLWVVLQPVISMVIFTFLFGNLLSVPSGEVPYPIFSYAALLPWNYFSTSLTRSSTSLVGSAHLITKVYFPRLVIPISGVLAGLIDFAVALVVLIALMAWYRIAPTLATLLLPAFLLLAMATALGFGLWLAALNVRYRDINYIVPYLVQVWMYATPVVYGTTLIPERYRFLLALNPMTAVVEGFR
ncbi:MAG: ABC transporter permease, partial [Chloroflexi bacterium]|nr:ABC transporter permease [Chloroflexota bacterium]